jgi:SAM-dependent methyltransferase
MSAWAPGFVSTPGGFKAEYFAHLAEVEADHFWFRARNDLIVWGLREYFPNLETFMEIGCGTGFVLSGIASAFPSAALVGSEAFIEGLGFAASRVKNARFIQMDGRKIPYEEEFDVIGAFDVLEHIEEDEAVLAEAFRATKPGGGLLLTVPQHPWLWSATDEYACHVRRYSPAEIHAKVRRAGFEIVRSTSFVSLLLPAILISRRRRQNLKAFNPLDEFRISVALNRALEAVLRLEHGLIRVGVSLPVGSSRFIVARKRPTCVL